MVEVNVRELILRGNAPEGLKANYLYLSGCTGLKALPEGLKANYLDLGGCTGLKALPEGLKADYLDLSGCTGLKALPEGLKADYLDLRGCTGLKALPEGLKANALDLRGCTGLKALPEGLKANTLDLRGCTGLKALPEGLKADYLDLRGCTGLKALPEGLKADYLDLRGCTGLKALPEGLKADYLDLRGCTGLLQPTTKTDNVAAWLEANGVLSTGGKVILYKAVDGNGYTRRGLSGETQWIVGNTYVHPAWDPVNSECGFGKYHACAKPSYCYQFYPARTSRIISIEVAIADLYAWPLDKAEYPTKIGFRKGIVLTMEAVR